jgi:hypothetical protein
VNAFRDSLGQEGVLYWKFAGIEQFDKLLRLHITRQVQAWKASVEQSSGNVPATKIADVDTTNDQGTNDDDQGILDLMETFESRFQELTAISERIRDAIEELGRKMTTRTTEMEGIPKDSDGNANRHEAKRLIAKAALDMNQFTARIEAELPLFRSAMNSGMNAFIRAATMSVEFSSHEDDANHAREGLVAIETLREAIASSIDSTSTFREIMAGLPRMTTELNRAKRGATGVLDKLLDEFSNGQTLLGESEKVIRGLLD